MNRRFSIICFTEQGAETAWRIAGTEELKGDQTDIRCKKADFSGRNGIGKLEGPLKEWTEQAFARCDGLIFVGATGIAVRSIAPFLKSKTTDPAVVVVDELGTFVISLVSGHIGGANQLCEGIARGLHALPVITTATDRHGLFAVDVFARKNHMWISDMKLAKQISADLLDGRKVGVCSEFPWEGNLPGELTLLSWQEKSVRERAVENEEPAPDDVGTGICISCGEEREPWAGTLHLIPAVCVLGLGCRKGKSGKELEEFVKQVLREHGLSLHSLRKVCSIDVKAQEPGILAFCEKYRLPFETFPADVLRQAPGVFTASSFVNGQVGVDNVCERSAVCGSNGKLIIKKTARDGMTAAVAIEEWRVCFE